MDTLFPERDYPGRDIVGNALLHQVVAVLPYPKRMGRLEFSLAVPLDPTYPTLLDVITGDGWHTRDQQVHFPRSSGMGTVVVPGMFGGTSYFKAQSTADISARRSRQAEATGSVVSKRIVVVLKPGTSHETAMLHANILKVMSLEGRQADSLGDKLLGITRSNPMCLDTLFRSKIITQEQLERLGQLIVAARRRAEDLQLIRDRGVFGYRGDGVDGLMGGGLKGGGGLHTGVGGYAGRMELSQESYAPDPFVPPIIYVLYPYGVAARRDLQPDIDAGVALVNNVLAFPG
jgi:hypothetical protein